MWPLWCFLIRVAVLGSGGRVSEPSEARWFWNRVSVMDGKKSPNFLNLSTNRRWLSRKDRRSKRSRRFVFGLVGCGVFGVLAVPIILWVIGSL